MTRQRPWKRPAHTSIVLGSILIGVISLTGAGRREPAPATPGSPGVAAPGGVISPGVARAEVDTLDLQLD